PLCGRWWWMGREFLVRWDDATAALMVSGTRPGVPPSRFTRRDDDEWVGRTGEHAGEVLRVRRAADGTVTALDISTYVLTRDPLPPDWSGTSRASATGTQWRVRNGLLIRRWR